MFKNIWSAIIIIIIIIYLIINIIINNKKKKKKREIFNDNKTAILILNILPLTINSLWLIRAVYCR